MVWREALVIRGSQGEVVGGSGAHVSWHGWRANRHVRLVEMFFWADDGLLQRLRFEHCMSELSDASGWFLVQILGYGVMESRIRR